MRMTERGIVALMAHEGVVPAPYFDSVGVLTFGVGHTKAAGAPDPAIIVRGMPSDLDAALRRAFEVFRHDLAKYEADVNRVIKVAMSQNEFDAAVSFHFNTGAIGKASWVRKFNATGEAAAGLGMMAYSKPAAIKPRRQAECDLFVKGVYPTAPVPVYGVKPDGHVNWHPIMTLTPAQALALAAPAARPAPVTPETPARPPVASPAPAAPPRKSFWPAFIAWLTSLMKGSKA